jgi:hypothetical protein
MPLVKPGFFFIKPLYNGNNAFKEECLMNGKTTSWIVTGVGAVVTVVGYMTGGRIGAGITGFGLAHVVLGILDMFRPTVRN